MWNDLFLLTGIVNEVLAVSVAVYTSYAIYIVFTKIPYEERNTLAIWPLVVILLLSLHYSYAQYEWIIEGMGEAVGLEAEIQWTIAEAVQFALYFHFIRIYTNRIRKPKRYQRMRFVEK